METVRSHMPFTSLVRLLAGPVLLAVVTGVAAAIMMLVFGPSETRTFTYRTPAYDTQDWGRIIPADPDTATSQDITVTDLGGPTPAAGRSQPRWARLTNPNRHDVLVTALRAAVGAPVDRNNRPVAGCPSDSLRLEPPPVPVTVAAMSTVDVAVTARLAADAPAACRGVRFPVTFAVGW